MFFCRIKSAIRQRWDAVLSRLRFLRPFSLSRHPRDWRVMFLRARVRELEAKEHEDIKYLRFQLTRTRAENTNLQNQVNSGCVQFATLLSMSEEELRKAASCYEVSPSDDDSNWTVVVEHCALCGCELETAPFRTERDALLYSALLNVAGYHARNNLSCSQCYREYLEADKCFDD